MKYSLINVTAESDGIISGYWLQNVIGTMETAVDRAKALVEANAGRIRVAIVQELPTSTPGLSKHFNLHPLGPISTDALQGGASC